jgi:selenocysteine lyase/cysteine desulfurase
LTERTRIVAVHHVSNLLGGIEDVAEIARMAHEVGARVVVDGVAFAPHRAMRVEEWDVDWYVFSTYQVYGPHMAALFGKREAFAELAAPGHEFLLAKGAPAAFSPAAWRTSSAQGCSACTTIWPSSPASAGRFRAEIVERSFAESALRAPAQTPDRRCSASAAPDRPGGPAPHVPTVSFVHQGRSSREIALAPTRRASASAMAFYAQRLCKALRLDPDDGVVRQPRALQQRERAHPPAPGIVSRCRRGSSGSAPAPWFNPRR